MPSHPFPPCCGSALVQRMLLMGWDPSCCWGRQVQLNPGLDQGTHRLWRAPLLLSRGHSHPARPDPSPPCHREDIGPWGWLPGRAARLFPLTTMGSLRQRRPSSARGCSQVGPHPARGSPRMMPRQCCARSRLLLGLRSAREIPPRAQHLQHWPAAETC